MATTTLRKGIKDLVIRSVSYPHFDGTMMFTVGKTKVKMSGTLYSVEEIVFDDDYPDYIMSPGYWVIVRNSQTRDLERWQFIPHKLGVITFNL